MTRFIAATLACAAIAAAPLASTGAETGPYAGQDGRAVSTLSESDIAALRAGDGWGLAKPAELNGWPGPRHVLDAAGELALTSEQREAIQAIHDAMRTEAQSRGVAYIEAERALDEAFRSGAADQATIAARTAAAAEAMAALRATHLTAHLRTAPLLTRHQKMIYARLRGYSPDGGRHGGHGRHED